MARSGRSVPVEAGGGNLEGLTGCLSQNLRRDGVAEGLIGRFVDALCIRSVRKAGSPRVAYLPSVLGIARAPRLGPPPAVAALGVCSTICRVFFGFTFSLLLSSSAAVWPFGYHMLIPNSSAGRETIYTNRLY